MSEIAELIVRLEKATGPDRELDEAILRFLGWEGSPLPSFSPTSSLDFVIEEVVPRGDWVWLVRKHSGKPLHDGVTGKRAKAFANVYTAKDDGPMFDVFVKSTPAIALCIAALKARENKTHEN